MPRKKVPNVRHCPYHVCIRARNREFFPIDMPTVWSIMEDYLCLVSRGYRLNIHAFVLMSNHYHLLVSAPHGGLSDALMLLNGQSSREINRLSGSINQVWGNRAHKTVIGGYHHFMNAYKYVHRNPVRARLCAVTEAYPYSTLNGLCGLSRLIIPVVEDTILFNPTFDQAALNWLNTESKKEHEEEIRLALRHSNFELKTCRTTGRPSELDKRLI